MSTLIITRITIITSYGADKIVLHTDLPSAVWPYQGQASVTMETAKGGAVEYVRQHFPLIEPEIINTRE